MPETLNPVLYRLLKHRYRVVKICNQGEAMQLNYVPDYIHRAGRPRIVFHDWGETYAVSCPFCTDTRFRLRIGHRWGIRDAVTGEKMLFLIKCHNEDCICTRERQEELYEVLFHGQMQPPKLVKTVARPRVPIRLPYMTSVDRLPANHPALTYLTSRRVDPLALARDYRVGWTDLDNSVHPSIRYRVVIPIYQPGIVTPTRLACWQARTIYDEEPKYLTAAGTHKNAILYGLPQAVATTGPVVIVEGIFDAWRVGHRAVALLGKTISHEQINLIRRHFAGRPLVVMLDPAAASEARKIQDQLRSSRRFVTRDQSPVVVASLPTGRKDPDECNPGEIRSAIVTALNSALDGMGGNSSSVSS